jgi:hypothetical protein
LTGWGCFPILLSMHGERLTWDQMRQRYPDEWLLIVDYDTDESGHLLSGVIERHSRSMREVAQPPALGRPTAFRYTGESTFRGLRGYAHRHVV